MGILDDIANVNTFDPATPLAHAASIQEANQKIHADQFKQKQTELGSEIRGLQPYVNTPDFAGKWAETSDRLLQNGVIDPQTHAKWRNAPSPLLMKSIISQTEDPTLSFNKERAAVTDQHWQKDYGIRSRAESRLNETPTDEADQRAAAAKKYGVDPTSAEGRSFALTGKLPEGDTTFAATINQRKAAATANGLDPSSPGFQSYVLTGKMPREDAQPLTATDKKAILEADEHAQTNQTTIENLQKAKQLSKQAMSGPFSKQIGYGTSLIGSEAGTATTDLNNLVTSNALQQLKSIFGGNPTEGERAILLDIQGSASQPDAVRQKIYDRAIEAAQKRLTFNKQRADELRGGQFYKPQGSMNRAPVKQGQGITQEEYNKLESGATFTAPDGTQRVKP